MQARPGTANSVGKTTYSLKSAEREGCEAEKPQGRESEALLLPEIMLAQLQVTLPEPSETNVIEYGSKAL